MPDMNPEYESDDAVFGKACPACGGSGEIEVEGIIGYVTHDMAIDGCCPERENEPIKGLLIVVCESCQGTGNIKRKGS